MKRSLSFFALAAIATLLLSGFASPKSHDADLKSLRDSETQWNQDFLAKDPARIAAHYADDAVFLNSGEPPVIGRTAILGVFTGLVSDPAFTLKLTTVGVDVSDSGDLGYTRGTYVFALTDPQSKQVIHDHGNYVTVYRKAADGSWKATEDVSVSDVAPAASK
jgi:uncharacterized protein (TIGR02246 family)